MGMDPAAAAAGHPGTGLAATARRSTQVVRLCQFRVVRTGSVWFALTFVVIVFCLSLHFYAVID